MIVVITGSSGFIGKRLTAWLQQEGHTVRVLVRGDAPARGDGIERYAVDYRRAETVAASGALEGAEVLIHLAGVTKALSLDAFRAGNVMPVQALVDAIHEVAPPLNRFVLASSLAAGGPAPSPDRPVSEEDPPRPFEAYGHSKLEAEQLLQRQSGDIPYTIVRPSAVYGPHDADFLNLFKQLRLGAGLYPANRAGRLAMIHVDDLIQGIWKAATVPEAAGQVFFLTHEENLSWPEVYAGIADTMGVPLRFELNVPAPLIALAGRLGDAVSRLTGSVSVVNSNKVALGLAPYWTCTAAKARDLLGYRPTIPLREGLEQTYRWYVDAGWL